MDKQVSSAFGKKCYLLGADKYGAYYWVEEGEFQCNWYWGIGYVETYTYNKFPNRSRDIKSHTHFSSLFFDGRKNGYDLFNEFFVKTPLSSKEV